MNILVPHQWLRDHLDTNAKPTDIQRCLSLCGPSVERIYEKDIYDIEITTNRVDSFCVRGIAREAAAILPEFGFAARLLPVVATTIPKPNKKTLQLPKYSDPHHLNRRTLAVILELKDDAPTPKWMADKLEMVGESVHSSAIDITNYITHELGHPCHAFDYDSIVAHGNTIKVDVAKKGESFITLDDETHETVGGEVVFRGKNGEIIDLPGIKGTANTAINRNTKRVLFWIESIDPSKIRFASMAHAIRTTAAQRNEKDVALSLMDDVLSVGVHWFRDLCGATVVSAVLDTAILPKPKAIKLPAALLDSYLGVELERERVAEILARLGCSVKTPASGWIVTPPLWRSDLHIPQDIVEEVARIYGYHRLPSELMATAIPTQYPLDSDFDRERNAFNFLAARGYQELLTLSLLSPEVATQTGFALEQHVAIKNPLSNEATHLQRSLLPSHINAIHKQVANAKIRGTFELANTFVPSKKGRLPEHRLLLAITDRDLRSLRSTVDSLQKFLGWPNLEWVKYEAKANISYDINKYIKHAAISTLNDRLLGTIGYLDNGWVGTELNWTTLLELSNNAPTLQKSLSYMPIVEDFTIKVPEQTTYAEVEKKIRALSKLIKAVELIDQYQNKWTFRITFNSARKQLQSADIQGVRSLLAQ